MEAFANPDERVERERALPDSTFVQALGCFPNPVSYLRLMSASIGAELPKVDWVDTGDSGYLSISTVTGSTPGGFSMPKTTSQQIPMGKRSTGL